MQFTPHQLKDKLLRGLDQDNNVVDMLGVLHVISVLEKYPITREALEATRLGKHINEMRKRTKNKDLAKRAKNLVRTWQHLVTGPEEVNGGGEQIAPIGGSRTAPGLPSYLKKGPGSKPASPISRPSIPANGKTSHSPKLPGGQGRCSTPVTATSNKISLSPKDYLKSQLAAGHNHVGYKPASPALSSGSSRNSPGLPYVKSEPIMHSNRPGTPTAAETLLKTNAANKKRRRGEPVDSGIGEKVSRLDDVNDDDSMKSGSSRVSDNLNGLVRSGSFEKLLDTPSSVHTSTPLSGSLVGLSARRNASFSVKTDSGLDKFNSSMSRTPVSSRTAKVASTAELIAKLRDKGLNTNICPDKIEKEKEEDLAVVPPEAKPRPRRKPGTIAPPTPDTPLSQTKSELVHKFLQTQMTPSPADLDMRLYTPTCSESPANLDVSNPNSVNTSAHSAGSSNHSYDFADKTTNKVEMPDRTDTDNQADSAPVNEVQRIVIDDPWSLLPPLNLDELNWEEAPYDVPERLPVSDTDVTRLHSEQWSNVNGRHDHFGVWRDWSQCLSLPTYDGGDLLHILPYVNIDDEC